MAYIIDEDESNCGCDEIDECLPHILPVDYNDIEYPDGWIV